MIQARVRVLDTTVSQQMKDRKNNYRISQGNTRRQKSGETIKIKDIIQEENGGRYNVWIYDAGYMLSTTDLESYKHPAIFPEKLAEDHIISWSNPGDIVMDIFSGSGTTCKMAKEHNRNFIGSEISSEYVAISEKRLRILDMNPKLPLGV